MNKYFILMLFALNLVYINAAMASSLCDQAIIFNDDGKADGDKKDGDKKDSGKKGGKKDGGKNPEEDCE